MPNEPKQSKQQSKQLSKQSLKMMPLSTMLTPGERLRVDAAGEGLYSTLHRESLDEVLADLRARKAGAVLVSITQYGVQSSARMAAMVREFPRVPAMALLTEAQQATPQHLLALGQLGVRILIDARQPSGWQALREILAAEKASDLQRTALGQLSFDLTGAPPDCWRFFELLFSHSPQIHSIRQLARHLNILPSTLMSRFFRANLPAPKRYLSLARLIRAAKLFENPGLSVASVANYLDYSSPQSFGRHVRTMMGVSPVVFRQNYDGPGMLQHFRTEVVTPYASILREFSPAATAPGWITRERNYQRKKSGNKIA
jgi:AraC-like DNA-binding protein